MLEVKRFNTVSYGGEVNQVVSIKIHLKIGVSTYGCEIRWTYSRHYDTPTVKISNDKLNK